MKQLPKEFENRMKNLLGADFELYFSELKNLPVKAFRVNTDKIGLEDFEKINPFSKEKIPYVKNGYYLDYEKIGNHLYHHAGLIYVQEPAAMAPAECVDIEDDWLLLDMCAAPGGKSTQLKNKLGENGVLVSNEIISSRCKILTGNIERLGLKNTVVTCMDTEKLASRFQNTFDLVMVDAPCSGEGMFRKEEIAIDEWSPENVQMCAKRQAEILENAVKALKSGGFIVYATCTFSLEENEMTVDAFLQKHPEFEIVPVNERVAKYTADGIKFEGCKCENIHLARRFYPHIAKGEGQFMAVLHHKGEKTENNFYSSMSKKTDKTVIEFLNDTLTDYNPDFVGVYNGNPIYYNNRLPIADRTAFCCGVTIGEIRKNYILPHHQFFMALGDKFKRKINLSVESDELSKYLHGEEFDIDCPNGWAVVMVDGCAV
ncbi:MAG: RsmB/NOP family class I SAM-dependent RNA methyltransferase, partial [Clostridia bacterium]|nr:RsmB/NOP family class I SAM-dependent RNA methyltransferase [Clostridia bacterium]